MLNLKKTTLVFFALISNATFAGSMGPTCMADGVTIPCEQTGWDFGVQALYLKPSYSSAMTWVGVNGTPAIAVRIENQPDWAWGFKLEAAYHFNTGNDLNLNWYHLVDKNTTMLSRETTIRNSTVGEHVTTINPGWDAVNLELGQRVNFGDIQNTRIHAGLQVANIETDISVRGPGALGDDPFTPYIYNVEKKARFTGAGPRIGADMFYGVFSSFNIYAKGAVTALAGTSKLTQTYNNSINTLEIGPTALSTQVALNKASSTTIIPEIEAKLGVNYTYALAHGAMLVDAGYLWINYFNTLVAVNSLRPVDNNFNVNGPYLGLKWIGAAV